MEEKFSGLAFLPRLDNEWHTLKHGNPVPGLYLQSGVETVRVRGSSKRTGKSYVTEYEIIVIDDGKVTAHYTVTAKENVKAVEKNYKNK
jgi:ketosteroid isomerase-like protein